MRIAILLLIATAFPLLSVSSMGIVTLVIIAALSVCSPTLLPRFFRGAWRLKWLFLAILIVYLRSDIRPPDALVILGYSTDAWIQVADRCLILLCLLAAVYLLIATQTQAQLVDAITRITNPLTMVGFDNQKLARRIGITFDSIAEAESILKDIRANGRAGLVDAASRGILAMENKADSTFEQPETQLEKSQDDLKTNDYFIFIFVALALGSLIYFERINELPVP